ncbi:ExbD/TolR family protein [Croceitalea vernalis]|uniref:Biopolymer transporter ExbD n=1 Tax=Croceitalea vernalis TaxID=3075599 RepID=A0ABU3BFL9_9FLAO|nr:biopolymer transporter ExbD [Croceitalea sp. P007]MDT0620960.1 biopolymer transporter ExbD [Croceitalea sp. P007]
MIKNRKNKKQLPAISTASLPDIVFILLFFFMTVTTMKNTNLLVENTLPIANETEEILQLDEVIEILIGKSTQDGFFVGTEPKIQLGSKFGNIEDISVYVLSEVSKMPEEMKKVAMVSLKVDKTAEMGIVTDVKKELRKVNMLKVNYTTIQGDIFNNL